MIPNNDCFDWCDDEDNDDDDDNHDNDGDILPAKCRVSLRDHKQNNGRERENVLQCMKGDSSTHTHMYVSKQCQWLSENDMKCHVYMGVCVCVTFKTLRQDSVTKL